MILPPDPDTAYMPVPRCDQCQHWDQSSPERGVCLKASAGQTKMWAELYDLVLTAPDFGCVQWEPKP